MSTTPSAFLAPASAPINAMTWFVQAAGWDELHGVIARATGADWQRPNERDIDCILSAASSTEARRVSLELSRRFFACRTYSTEAAYVASKALLVLQRVALAGFASALPDATSELQFICSEGTTSEPATQYVLACAKYVRLLCAWDRAAHVRSKSSAADWRAAPMHVLLQRLPQMQTLLSAAFECAALGPTSDDCIEALRVAIVEDALCLFRGESAAVAALLDGLLGLQPHLAGGRNGAVELVEAFLLHAAQALALQQSLAEEVKSDTGPYSAAKEVADMAARRRLWPSTPVSAFVPDNLVPDARLASETDAFEEQPETQSFAPTQPFAPTQSFAPTHSLAPSTKSFAPAPRCEESAPLLAVPTEQTDDPRHAHRRGDHVHSSSEGGCDNASANAHAGAHGVQHGGEHTQELSQAAAERFETVCGLLTRVERERASLLRCVLDLLPAETAATLASGLLDRDVDSVAALQPAELALISADAVVAAARACTSHAHHSDAAMASFGTAESDPALALSHMTPAAFGFDGLGGGAHGSRACHDGLHSVSGRTVGYGAFGGVPREGYGLSMPDCTFPGSRAARSNVSQQHAMLLPPLPLSVTPLMPQLVAHMSDEALRIAAYELVLLATSTEACRASTSSASSSIPFFWPPRPRAVSSSHPSRCSEASEDECALEALRTQLGITRRQHRRITALLFPPAEADVEAAHAQALPSVTKALHAFMVPSPPLSPKPLPPSPQFLPPPPTCEPAYRVWLLLRMYIDAHQVVQVTNVLHAPGTVREGRGYVSEAGGHVVEVLAFVSRQLALLHNAFGEEEESAAALRRVEPLLSAFVREQQKGRERVQTAMGVEQQPDAGSEASRLKSIQQASEALAILGVQIGDTGGSGGTEGGSSSGDGGGGGGGGGCGELGSSSRSGELGGGSRNGDVSAAGVGSFQGRGRADARAGDAETGVVSAESVLRPCRARMRTAWPMALGFTLYCTLLHTLFDPDADDGARLAPDHESGAALLRSVWAPLRLGEAHHQLAMLTAVFARYQQSGAPALLPLLADSLEGVLALAGKSALARSEQPAARHDAGGAARCGSGGGGSCAGAGSGSRAGAVGGSASTHGAHGHAGHEHGVQHCAHAGGVSLASLGFFSRVTLTQKASPTARRGDGARAQQEEPSSEWRALASAVDCDSRWMSEQKLLVLDAIAAFLGGKMRDYHAHFGNAAGDLRACVPIWRQCVLSLESASAGASPVTMAHGHHSGSHHAALRGTGDVLSSVRGASGPAHVEASALAAIETAAKRHVRRIKLRLEKERKADFVSGARGRGELSAEAQQALTLLAAALCDEVEGEAEFAACFACCMRPRQGHARRAGFGVQTSDGSSSAADVARRHEGTSGPAEGTCGTCGATHSVDAVGGCASCGGVDCGWQRDGQTCASRVHGDSAAQRTPASEPAAHAAGLSMAATAREKAAAEAAAVGAALAVYESELRSAVLALMMDRRSLSIDRGSLELVKTLSQAKQCMECVLARNVLPELETMRLQMAEGWCARLHELWQSNLRAILLAERWQPLSELSARPLASSVIDLFTQLDKVVDVFVPFAAVSPPLSPAALQRFLDVLETAASQYCLSVLASCLPLPPSQLQAALEADAVAIEPAPIAAQNDIQNPFAPGALVAAAPIDEPQPLAEAVLKLNSCDCAARNVLTLSNKLRDKLPQMAGVSPLMPGAERMCETACSDLAEHIISRIVVGELGPLIANRLYAPSPLEHGARMHVLLSRLSPLLAQLVRTVAGSRLKGLLVGLLTKLARAIGLVLSGRIGARDGRGVSRHFERQHRVAIAEDLEALHDAFCATGALDEQMARRAVAFVDALADEACGVVPRHEAVGTAAEATHTTNPFDF